MLSRDRDVPPTMDGAPRFCGRGAPWCRPAPRQKGHQGQQRHEEARAQGSWPAASITLSHCRFITSLAPSAFISLLVPTLEHGDEKRRMGGHGGAPSSKL